MTSYLDQGKNPDLFTKEVLSGLVRESEIVRGKMRALAHFEEELQREVVAHYPHLEPHIRIPPNK